MGAFPDVNSRGATTKRFLFALFCMIPIFFPVVFIPTRAYAVPAFGNNTMASGLMSTLAIIPAAVILDWVLIEALVGSISHQRYATLALLLFIIAAQGFTVSTISLSLKLTLRQFERRLRRR